MNSPSNTKPIGNRVALGAGFGAFVGILAALLANTEVTYSIIFGAGAGTLTGLLTGTFVERRLAQGKSPSGPAIGAGIGLVSGASVGLVAAWALTANVGLGIILGAGAGLVIGIFLGRMVYRMPNQGQDISGMVP